jgi:hypothetical protein
MHIQTATPINRAIWLPPLSELLPNREMATAKKPMSTTTGMMAMRGWGSLTLSFTFLKLNWLVGANLANKVVKTKYFRIFAANSSRTLYYILIKRITCKYLCLCFDKTVLLQFI